MSSPWHLIYLLFDIIYDNFNLTGGTVEIDVADKTTLRGAVIASDPSAGSGQAGELRLDTGSFEYSRKDVLTIVAMAENKVSTYLSMDDFERKIENGDSVSAQDKLNYYSSKDFVGEELSPQEQLDRNLAVQTRKIEVTSELKQDILDTWKDSTALIVNSKLAVLRELDPAAAAEIDSRFAGIREAEKERIYVKDEISKIATDLAYDENKINMEVNKVQKLLKENAVLCIQTESKIENQYYVLTKNDGIQLDGKGEYGKAVYTVNTDTIEYIKEEEGILSSKFESSTSGQSVAKIDYNLSVTGSNSVYGGVNPKGAVIGISRNSADFSSNGSGAYSEKNITITGKGAVAGTAVVVVTVAATIIIKNPSAAAQLATQLIPPAVPVIIQTAK